MSTDARRQEAAARRCLRPCAVGRENMRERGVRGKRRGTVRSASAGTTSSARMLTSPYGLTPAKCVACARKALSTRAGLWEASGEP